MICRVRTSVEDPLGPGLFRELGIVQPCIDEDFQHSRSHACRTLGQFSGYSIPYSHPDSHLFFYLERTRTRQRL